MSKKDLAPGGRGAFDALDIPAGLPLRFCSRKGGASTWLAIFFVRLACLARTAARPFRPSNQRPQGRIHGLLVGKILSFQSGSHVVHSHRKDATNLAARLCLVGYGGTGADRFNLFACSFAFTSEENGP